MALEEPPDILRVTIPSEHLTKQGRRDLSRWLVANCGRPDRRDGFWWTEEGGRVICFAVPQHFVLFQLTWC